MRKQILAVLLVKMHDQFGVAVGAEHMPLGFELCTPLGKIKELAVTDDRNAAILVENRLSAVMHPNDAQPPMSKTDARSKQKPAIIRSAMSQRRRHTAYNEAIGLASAREINQSCNATHNCIARLVVRLIG